MQPPLSHHIATIDPHIHGLFFNGASMVRFFWLDPQVSQLLRAAARRSLWGCPHRHDVPLRRPCAAEAMSGSGREKNSLSVKEMAKWDSLELISIVYLWFHNGRTFEIWIVMCK